MEEQSNDTSAAVRPTSHFGDFPSLDDPIDRPDTQPEADPEEASIYTVSRSAGWEHIKEYIAELQKELDQMVLILMEQGASFEEIGQKTLVKEVTKAYLQRILDKVET